jgi:type II secretory pathway component PulJ
MRRDRGAALLEVLVALTILTVAGLSLVGLLSAGVRAEQDARERERVLADEERVLAAMTLLTRADLDRRLGRHEVGEFVVDVQRPERTLYRIAIGQPSAAHVEDLVTVVFRRAEEVQ